MLEVKYPTDYLKKEGINPEVVNPLEEEKQYTQQGHRPFQPKHRIRRQYNPDDTNIAKLFLAIREHGTGNPKISKISEIKELLTQVKNINDIDFNDNGNTPLHVALSKEHQDIVELLLNVSGIDVNIKNNQGDTPLHIATSKGNKELVQLLLSKQAKIDIKNNKGKSPLDIANRLKRQDIVKILEAHLKSPSKPSSQVETLSKQEKEVRDKLREFVEDFVFIYESSLSEYYERLESQRAKPGKWADFINGVLEIGKGGTEGIEVAGIKAPSIVGINALQNIISSAGTWHNRKELKKLISQLYIFKEYPDRVREELVKSGIDIFRNFESQFIQVTADGSWQRAMTKLAHDAVDRSMSYYKKNAEEEFSAFSITKGVLLGESKRYKHTSTGTSHIEPGHSLKDKHSNSWNTAELFDKAGLVTIKSDGTADKYYKRKGGKSDTSKYGYRLLFQWESEDRVELAKKLNVEYQKEKPPKEEYKYILKPNEKEKLKSVLLDYINNQGPQLMEERLKENFKAGMEQIKQEAEKSFNELENYIDKNFDKLSSYIEGHQNEIKEIFSKIEQQNKRHHQEASQQREKIARDNKDEHKKTQAGVENANQGINNLQKGQEVIINEIRTLGKDQDKKPIWFDVRDPVTSFTALSLGGKGRQDMLDRVAGEIQQGIVVISGLEGVGKSELAIKYAHDHSKDYEGNVIWINAETQETLKESFHRLAKEKLKISIKDIDGEEKSIKSIIENVYEYFADGKSLFIFDNAEKYALVEKFLPLSLSPNTNKPDVLITSPNNLEWEKSVRGNIKVLPSLGDFTDVEAIEFVKKVLEIKDDSQNQGITELVKKLHNFPLALQQAAAYIKDTNEAYQKRNLEFKVSDYLKKYQETPKKLLNVKLPTGMHAETIFKTLEVTLDKIKNEEYGQQSLNMLNIISYFAPSNIPEEMFLSELASGDQDKLISITSLLEKYSIVRLEQGMLSVHGLVQQVRRLELVEQKEGGKVLEEETLAKALRVLKEHMKDRNSVEHYASHVTSAWNYVSKYDKLIESFIVNDIDDKAAYTKYFHLIAEGSSYEVVEAIINKVEQSNKLKEVINAKDKDRGRPLHNAALSGDERIVKLLIEKGANVNVRKKHGWTPLHLAAKNGYLEVVKVLLDNGAKVSDKTGYKFTSLHLAARNGYPEVVELLLDEGSSVGAQDRHEYTPLHFAVKNNHFEVVQVLLKNDKIDVNIETEHKVTPLHFAAKNGNLDIVKALLEKGAEVNVKDKGNFTPLHLATFNNHIEVVNDLLKRSEIDINAKTTEGNTPLHLAAEQGNLEIVRALIAGNADVKIKNAKGKVASDLANEKDHLEVKNYIIQNWDKEEVLINQVEQPKFNKRQGTSGISGQLYEIELSMLFLLEGVTRKEDKKIDSFYLATNMEEAGDFDDVVFKYKYNENGVEKSKIVFLQAKHKETEKNEKETKGKEKKITIDTLLSQSEKGDFLLRKYLSSYRKIKQLRLKEDHLIFKDGVESCDFVIYTNALFNFDKSRDSVEEKDIEPRDILNLKGDSQKYYQLNAGEKVMDALRRSLDYEILVRELAQSISFRSIDGNKPIFKDYQVSLAERVIEKKNQREGKLRDDFLNGEQDREFSSALFEEIKKRKEFPKKSVDELKEELRGENIQLPNNFGSAEKNDLKLPLPSKLFSDDEIKEFLSKLKLFVGQPNEGQLGEIIKQKIQSIYKVEQNDIDTVFSDVEYKVRNWWKEGDKYLTESNKFFQEAARVSINFDVKEPVTLFTGRIRELENLHKILQDGGEAVISQMASVTGLGGVGKSELARKYVSKHNKDYDDNVIWINADNYLTIAESFRRLAQDKLQISTTDENGKEKEIKLIVEDVYRFFAKRHRRSLFVFDNAGKHKAVREGKEAEGVDKFLPSGPDKPHILITSRDQEWGEIKSLPLGVFTEEEAIEFIEKALKGVVGLEKNEVKRLAEELQYLPLALRQAVAYIKVENQGLNKWGERKFTIGSYLEQFKEKANELLSKGSSETRDRYTETVMTTWQITIDKIKQKKVRGGEQALEILDVIAYLAPDKIPIEGIFSKLISDKEELHNAVELLDQYSMANLEQGVLNIHRLVQQVTRIELKGQNKEREVLREALRIFKDNVDPSNLDHAISAWSHASEHEELVKEFSDLPSKIVSELKDSVRYEKAYLFGVKALKTLEDILGPGHPDFLSIKHNIAGVLYNQGKYKEALKAYQKVLDKRTEILGPNHPDTLSTMNNIAGVLDKQGKYEEALKTYQEVLDKQTPDHSDTLFTIHNIAGVLYNQGKYKEALTVYQKVLDKRTEILEPNHPDTLSTMNNIAVVLDRQGKYEEALKTYQEVLDKQTPDHPGTLFTMHNIAGVLYNQGKYKEALTTYQKVLDKRIEILGPNHPDTLSTMHNIAAVLDDQSKYKEALTAYQKVLDKRIEILGPNHPDTFSTMNNVAVVLYNQEKYEEALKAYQEVLDKKTKILKSDHPSTLNTLNNIATVFEKQGEYDKALEVYQEVRGKFERILGPDHPSTLNTLNNIATVLEKQGEYDKALEVYQEVRGKFERILEPDHPDTLSIMKNIALLLERQGKYEEALKAYREVLDKRIKIWGYDHPDTLSAIYNVILVLSKQGRVLDNEEKYEEALKAYKEVLDKKTKIFGLDHLSTLSIRNSIAKVLAKQGEYNEALQTFQEVYRKRKEILGESHSDVRETKDNMDKLSQLKSRSSVENIQGGHEHFEVVRILNNLGDAYGALGDFQKAYELYEKSSKITEKQTPLHLAIWSGNLKTVKYVLEKGADVLARDNHDTVLHQAVSGGNEELIRLILEKIKERFNQDLQQMYESINAPDTEGDTPLMWAAKNGKTNAAKILLEYGADLNVKNNDGETALHWAAKGDYQEIVQLLLNKKADPNIQDNNEKTPLDLAQEKLFQDSENDNLKKITGLLLSVTDESKSQHREEQTLALEECLPSTSHNRRKRNAENECLFTWEDVDEFNVEKDEKRDFSKINIDSEKFVNYIKNLSEEKRSQLIGLADQVEITGKSQGLVNRLIGNQKIIGHLNKVGKISGMAMHGMMAKNVLADFLNGNYQGVAVNVGFIAGGQGFAKVAEAASLKGLELASKGKFLLSRSLKAASPFLARGTSAFVVYDLINQVKEYKNGTEEALVGIVGDGIYLGVDATEIGIEVAEAFELLEGVSSVTGPIGATIGAVVFVGTDIYMAVKRVDKIDEIIHLTGNEKFVEGLRAFIGMQPQQYIEELMEEKQVNNQLVNQGLEYLQQHSDIKRYIFPTGKSVVDSCSLIPYDATKCIRTLGLNGGRCLERQTVTNYYRKCTNKFEVDLNNEVLLDSKGTDIKWSRARPDNPNGGELFCLPQGDYEPAPSHGSYFCESAIGVTDLNRNKIGNYTLINLGEGNDYAKGFVNSGNIFVVNDGLKRYYGGNKDDIFILQGSAIKGYLSGEAGVNTLDLTSFAPEEESMDVRLDIGKVEDYDQNNSFGVSGVNRFLGRKDKEDFVSIACDSDTSDVKFIDGQGGSERFKDQIEIYDENCGYEMQVVVRPNTVIHNRALEGSFNYTVPYGFGSAKVDFIYSPQDLNVNNTFTFEYEPVEIKNINVRNINVLNKTSHVITFNFAPMSNKEFNITISGASNPSYRLGSGSEIKVGNKGNLYMLQNTNQSVDEIIKSYLSVANRLNKMSFFIQSLANNETVVIGSGNYEVIHNNPLHKSHLVGNGGENVYVIDSRDKKLEVPEVVIYDLDVESSVDTIDLRNLVQQVRGKLSNKESFELKIIKLANDLLLKGEITELKKTEDSFVSEMKKHECFTVRLKDGVNLYNKTHVILNNVPMGISFDNNEWSLKPLPLKFEKDKEVIIVTSQDIEENTELITPKIAGNYSFVRDHGSDLMITNAFDASVAKNDLCTIVLSKFYETPKMATLSIKFADKEINLKDHQEQISTARDVNVVKKEYKDQVYSDVFNYTGSKVSPEVMVSDQPMGHKHRHEHSRQQRRHRRHHHNKQDLSHAVGELSNQAVSSSTRLSSRINDLFGWIKSSIGGLFNSRAILVEERPKTTSSISQVDARADVNSAIMLLDVLVRKVTGQKYISTVEQQVPLLEARSYALNITERFEKVVEQAAKGSKISMHRLNIDFMEMEKEITGKIIGGKFNEIAGVLSSYVEKACPGREAGKLSSKKFDKFMTEFNNKLDIALNQSILPMVSSGHNTLEINSIKEQNLENKKPKSYLDNISAQGHLTHKYLE